MYSDSTFVAKLNDKLIIMKSGIKFVVAAWCLLGVFNVVQAQIDTTENKSPFNFEASYIGDVVSNFFGGIKRGTTYLGLANIKAGFDTKAANWWKGGQIFINLGNTHGGKPTEMLVGDFQGVSNIEAGNLTFLYELWYKQNLGNVNITVGLQDLNANFANTENGCLFTNSSFGIHSSIADNIPSPIFPLTALGVNLQWNMFDSFVWESAVFDGTPDDFETNPYNTNWKLSKEQGFLAVTEFQLNKSLVKNRAGIYKLGLYFHQHRDTINVGKRNGGLYFVVDQQLTDRLSFFSQIGLSPRKMNKNNYYLSAGLSCKAPFEQRVNDQVGIALAYAGISGNVVGSETAVELAYHFELNKHIYIKPDIQYIINPAGTDEKLDNALVGFVRFGVDF